MANSKLIIDGNLLARASFYKFKNLSVSLPIGSLRDLSESFYLKVINSNMENFHVEPEVEEKLSNQSGNLIAVTQGGKIDDKIKKIKHLDKKVKIITGTLFGMLRSILLVTSKNPNINEVIICYDPIGGKEKGIIPMRHSIIPDYKNRSKDEETEKLFNTSLHLAMTLFYHLGIKQASSSEYEADDLLQFFSHKVYKSKKVFVMTKDHDLYQVIEKDRVVLIRNGMKPIIYGHEDFKKEFGISPKQWRDVQALGGCGTDNVKGVRGISPETAINLIRQFGSLKKLMKNYKNGKTTIEKRIINLLDKERFENKNENLIKSFKLVSLYGKTKGFGDNVEIIQSKKSIKYRIKRARKILKILRFNSFLTEEGINEDIVNLLKRNK